MLLLLLAAAAQEHSAASSLAVGAGSAASLIGADSIDREMSARKGTGG
jgi:hypothetical protein